MGPTGTGKSLGAFIVARQKEARGWKVTWVSYREGYPVACFRFCGDEASYCSSLLRDAVSMGDLLD